MEGVYGPECVKGRVRAHQIDENRIWRPSGPFCPNAVMFDWAGLASRLFTSADPRYRISGMYLEYKNLADPSTVVTPPSFTRDQGISYYSGLSSSSTVDYLRVPLSANALTNTDTESFTIANAMTLFAMSQGSVGVNGKPFASGNNSKVYGGALVALVDENDRTNDVVFSRFYFPTNQQRVKLSGGQLGLEWQIVFG